MVKDVIKINLPDDDSCDLCNNSIMGLDSYIIKDDDNTLHWICDECGQKLIEWGILKVDKEIL